MNLKHHSQEIYPKLTQILLLLALLLLLLLLLLLMFLLILLLLLLLALLMLPRRRRLLLLLSRWRVAFIPAALGGCSAARDLVLPLTSRWLRPRPTPAAPAADAGRGDLRWRASLRAARATARDVAAPRCVSRPIQLRHLRLAAL